MIWPITGNPPVIRIHLSNKLYCTWQFKLGSFWQKICNSQSPSPPKFGRLIKTLTLWVPRCSVPTSDTYGRGEFGKTLPTLPHDSLTPATWNSDGYQRHPWRCQKNYNYLNICCLITMVTIQWPSAFYHLLPERKWKQPILQIPPETTGFKSANSNFRIW